MDRKLDLHKKIHFGMDIPFFFTPWDSKKSVLNKFYTLQMLSTGAEADAKVIYIENYHNSQEEIGNYLLQNPHVSSTLFILVNNNGGEIIGYIDRAVGISEVFTPDTGRLRYRYFYSDREGEKIINIRHIVFLQGDNARLIVDLFNNNGDLNQRAVYISRLNNMGIDDSKSIREREQIKKTHHFFFYENKPARLEYYRPINDFLCTRYTWKINEEKEHVLTLIEYLSKEDIYALNYFDQNPDNGGINNPKIHIGNITLSYRGEGEKGVFSGFPISTQVFIDFIDINHEVNENIIGPRMIFPLENENIINVRRNRYKDDFSELLKQESPALSYMNNVFFPPLFLRRENRRLKTKFSAHYNYGPVDDISELPLEFKERKPWFRFLFKPRQTVQIRQAIRKTKLEQSRRDRGGKAGIIFINNPHFYWEELFKNGLGSPSGNPRRNGVYLVYSLAPWFIFLGYVTYSFGVLDGLTELLYPDGSLITQRDYEKGNIKICIDHKTYLEEYKIENKESSTIPLLTYRITEVKSSEDKKDYTTHIRLLHVENEEGECVNYRFCQFDNERCLSVLSYINGVFSRMVYWSGGITILPRSEQVWWDSKMSGFRYREFDKMGMVKKILIKDAEKFRVLEPGEELYKVKGPIPYGIEFYGFQARIAGDFKEEQFLLTPEKRNIENFNVISRNVEEDEKIERRLFSSIVDNDPFFPGVVKPTLDNPVVIVFGSEGGINDSREWRPLTFLSDEPSMYDQGEGPPVSVAYNPGYELGFTYFLPGERPEEESDPENGVYEEVKRPEIKIHVLESASSRITTHEDENNLFSVPGQSVDYYALGLNPVLSEQNLNEQGMGPIVNQNEDEIHEVFN